VLQTDFVVVERSQKATTLREVEYRKSSMFEAPEFGHVRNDYTVVDERGLRLTAGNCVALLRVLSSWEATFLVKSTDSFYSCGMSFEIPSRYL
jgi:hypothetical protein